MDVAKLRGLNAQDLIERYTPRQPEGEPTLADVKREAVHALDAYAKALEAHAADVRAMRTIIATER